MARVDGPSGAWEVRVNVSLGDGLVPTRSSGCSADGPGACRRLRRGQGNQLSTAPPVQAPGNKAVGEWAWLLHLGA